MTDDAIARRKAMAGPALDAATELPVLRSHYKAKIDAVSPEWCRTTFEREHDDCFVGISLDNSNFVRSKLFAILEWITRRFRRCTVLIGDSIHRITLETTHELAPEVALDEALRRGRAFVEHERHVFDWFAGHTEFRFVNCSEVQTWAGYAGYHDRLRALFESDHGFRASVEWFGRSYHGKHSQGVSDGERARRIARSSEYFLEEFAVFACLRERGLRVMVYPGSFSTLTEIARGTYPSAPPELRELVVVSLHMRGR